MRKIFADTSYWIGLINPRDQLHTKAKDVSSSLGNVIMITSEFVLAELLNALAEFGPKLRSAAIKSVTEMRSNPNVKIIPLTSKGFRAAMDLYDKRNDKGWSLTDCASFLIMQDYDINEALTYDHHFEQMRFKALLRNG